MKFTKKRRQGQSYLWIVDRIVITVALAGAFIRFGNFVNSEIIGKPTGSDYGVVFGRVAEERLEKAVEDVNIVIHTAALKQVPVIEYNPFEAIKTNVQGSQNLVEACLKKDVEFALAIGTDKAVSPFNTYGATKLLMERLFVSANYHKGAHKTKFACVRYGNVLGSRGSIIPKFIEQIISGNKITITDPNMTRFNITIDQALDLIFRVIKNAVGGDVHIPKLDAFKVGDVKDVLLDLMGCKNEEERIPVRIGEKFHEILLSIIQKFIIFHILLIFF